MKIKKETDGSFKNAKFSSQGCTVIGGQLNNLPYKLYKEANITYKRQ